MIRKLNESRKQNRKNFRRKLSESVSNNPFMRSKYANLIDPEYMNILGTLWTKLSALTSKINQNINIMHWQDAKLYKVFYNFENVSDVFLDIEWHNFEEYVEEHECEIESVRHSNSKFYVRNSFLSRLADRTGNDPNEVGEGQVLSALYDSNIGGYAELFEDAKEMDDYIDWHLEKFYEDEEPTTDNIKEILAETIDDYEYLANDGNYIFKYANEYVDDAVAVIDYIESFKKNQVAIYQDFLDANGFEEEQEEL